MLTMRIPGFLAMLVLCLSPAHAETKLSQVTLTVGFSPGGGTDTFARLFGRYLPNYLQDIAVIVQNMPGSGSLKAVQSLSTPAAPGTVSVGTFNYGLITESMVSPERVHIKLSDYRWIGSLASVPAICFAWQGTGVRSLEDLKRRATFNVGAPAVGSSNYVNGMMMKNVLGLPVRVVTGYPGSADERLAIERGELDGGCGAWSSIPPDWISARKIVPLVNFSVVPVMDLPASTPTALALAPSETDRQLVKFFTAPSTLGRPFIVSRTTPAETVELLRNAFDKVAKDAQFLAEAARMNLPADAVDGKKAEQIVSEIYATPTNVIESAKTYMQ
jgi:tripartite-type tricarboxylate transporter receptor subunit TctC